MDRATDRATVPDLLRFLYRQTAGERLWIIVPSVISGLARGALLAAFNEAASRAGAVGLDLGLIAIFAACLVLYLTGSYASAIASDRLVRSLLHRLRLSISERLIHAPLRLVETQDPGKIFTLIGHESENLAGVAKDFIITFQAAIVLAFALSYLAWLSPPSFLLSLVIIVAGAATYYWNDRKAKDRYRLAREKEVEYFDAMYDLLHGFKDLKLGKAQQDEIISHLRRVSGEFRGLGHASERIYQISQLVSHAFTFLLIALIVFVIPMLFPGGPISIYQLLATVLYLLAPVEQMISSVPSFSRGAIALANIGRLEQAIGRETPPLSPTPRLPASFERITLRQAHFEFRSDNAHENFDLGPIDLEIRRGESLFIIGGNGAGKTTLLKLIAGLYHPTSGDVFLDGERIAGANSADYREFFAVIFNEPYLMKRLYGLQDFDPEFEKALLAELGLEHKTALSDGRFTTTKLSAGQRKRLSYAISRLRDRQVYIFDEFAADQDPQFRAYFYTTLLPKLKREGKTIIAVTHDDRWFGAGDRLLKLEYGKIIPLDLSQGAIREM